MKIHEYQAKDLFRNYGVAVPEGYPAFSVKEALEAYDKLNTETVVVKAQIHAGGRGKGGGVKLAHSRSEVEELASKILGMNLVTHQTGSEGKEVQRLLIEEGVNIQRELYAGIVLDRAARQYVFMVSTEGGVEIEKVAAETPEKIIKEWINPENGFTEKQGEKLAVKLGLANGQISSAVDIFTSLWNVFSELNCSLLEINPLVVTSQEQVIALDAKMNLDSNGLFHHRELLELRDKSEEDPAELSASQYNLNYINLDGNVGCMVNGAGLAMATMDIIKLTGGEPANFLDVGGVANAETVANGFKIILSDPNVKSILINIFGGIVRCDRVAQGVIDAMDTVNVTIPVVVRLEGTNAKEAAELLNNSSLEFLVATSLQDAAEKAVSAATGGHQ
ncbi:MAG TPA: ADP-forming succinate--CoA ligase subunit beta [Candidatus Marinimicrobia bacterium]|jgi:succinyl-CoA synthetase beta subunit|nr:ADP-forming succinate--CoA ligase subunit beta [Candidatus Neomarinimicrobiota bacterium]MDP6142724.1 ADP-forming succinate--CoA ligase subunit beta [Candidatus Neomarinimicrobiota bacterium]MDP6260868.1 ADP-forming succinate--CoA ligase subunit beta [Candidatus Neomarinimicrobiota bacterium]MDP7128016.1 ADP-forming succinate--CoA ligase subunit beta [Candidatus Neomarinimicrobiota bacterium]MDP7337025.1 ADP-forming succinate--CoA ligase subunit beta [Candidatus Neomarinimicrobiota bacterium|tara:strand:+ start:4591 stop:5763 length:1173 start_codon:yes stop_codon:yes gene_type:complete